MEDCALAKDESAKRVSQALREAHFSVEGQAEKVEEREAEQVLVEEEEEEMATRKKLTTDRFLSGPRLSA
nr:hypothetical protein CFP56_04847 [Quercus suber]